MSGKLQYLQKKIRSHRCQTNQFLLHFNAFMTSSYTVRQTPVRLSVSICSTSGAVLSSSNCILTLSSDIITHTHNECANTTESRISSIVKAKNSWIKLNCLGWNSWKYCRASVLPKYGVGH
jgi:hypothetical protein